MTSVQIWEGNVKRTWQYIHVHKHSATVSSSSSATSKGSSASSSVTSSSTNQPTYLDLSEIQTETNDNTNNLTTLRPVSEGHYVSKHNIILYHDTITGTRSLAVDFEEVPESLGISSTFLGVNQVIRDTTNMPTTHSGKAVLFFQV